MNELLHIGVDVDDKSFHIAGFCESTGEIFEVQCKPNPGALLKCLKKFKALGFEIITCYEATYIGFSLHRFLKKNGVKNIVVAPSLIPTQASDRVKTDRLDSLKLAKYLAKDLLTEVYVPDEKDEARRDLVRSRSFIVSQRSDLKRHLLAALRRYGLDYKSETGGKTYWTNVHLNWLEVKLKSLEPCARTNVEMLLTQYSYITKQLDIYNEEINKISNEARYKKRVDTLCCFKGISRITALTLITEIGDIKRFSHPNKLTSYAGLDIREYSSGGRELKFGITKMGNRRIRTAVVEACQVQTTRLYMSRRLKLARENQPAEVIDVADRCMKRLKKKTTTLRLRNKHNNKIKVACARELLCFTWEALQLVS